MFQAKLRQLEEQGRRRVLDSSRNGVDLTSNDYLGFANHPFLKRSAIEFFENGGSAGAAASRLLRGEMEPHHALEDFAADYFDAPAALFFSSGFQANYALMTTLTGRGDTIIFDSLIHASSRDGIQASFAKHIRVAHNDLNAYEAVLKKARAQSKGKIFVAVESVYSMDGDFAPLSELLRLCLQYDAYLIVDEAHGVGIFGDTGKGRAENLMTSLRAQAKQSMDCRVEAGASPYNDGWPDNLIVLHTCGKALGVAGGLVCASREVCDYLVNAARPFIYSTAPMPVQAHLVQRSLELLASDEGQAQRRKLLDICAAGKEYFGGYGSPIIPIQIGSDRKSIEVASAMQERGFDVRAIRPPTVPEGTARLRVSLNANLSKKTLRDFADTLSSVLESKHDDQ